MPAKYTVVLLIFACTLAACKKKKEPTPTQSLLTPSISNFTLFSRHIGDPNFRIPIPESNSTAAFTYTSENPDIAAVVGDSIQIKSAGSVRITATQKATNVYESGSITATFVVLPNVYIAGYTYASDGHTKSLYWKNGDTINLRGHGAAIDIVVQGHDVYMAGNMENGGIYAYPGYWKNGLQTIFSKNGNATGIAAVGNDIYVVGFVNTFDSSDHYLATLWKNGIEIPLQNPVACCGLISSSVATGITVRNNEVYICGVAYDESSHFSSAMIWRADGTATALSKPSSSRLTDTSSVAFGVNFQGGDMYLCGTTSIQNGNSFLTYWKNGLPIPSTAAVNNSKFSSILANGSDVYTAGIDAADGLLHAAFWKNGAENILSINAEANKMSIQGDDIYVVGNTYPNTNYTIATPVYWLNGSINYLLSPNNTRATAITIMSR